VPANVNFRLRRQAQVLSDSVERPQPDRAVLVFCAFNSAASTSWGHRRPSADSAPHHHERFAKDLAGVDLPIDRQEFGLRAEFLLR
jgi:hypothetical protein